MIDYFNTKIGMHVFYQQPHMSRPEYGIIVSMDSAPTLYHVLFFGETTAKACNSKDLYWPPNFCKQDQCNPDGQIFQD